MGAKGTNWHQRHALQIAAQLPEEKRDALEVLRFAEKIVRFLDVEDDPDPSPGPREDFNQSVLKFPNTPRRRASSKGKP